MSLRVRVCFIHEIIEGEIKCFTVPGVTIPVLVTMIDGRIIAGSSMCPHEDVSLSKACIEKGVIVCKAHGYRFDIFTGQCEHEPKLKWSTYVSHVVEGELFVDLI